MQLLYYELPDHFPLLLFSIFSIYFFQLLMDSLYYQKNGYFSIIHGNFPYFISLLDVIFAIQNFKILYGHVQQCFSIMELVWCFVICFKMSSICSYYFFKIHPYLLPALLLFQLLSLIWIHLEFIRVIGNEVGICSPNPVWIYLPSRPISHYLLRLGWFLYINY